MSSPDAAPDSALMKHLHKIFLEKFVESTVKKRLSQAELQVRPSSMSPWVVGVAACVSVEMNEACWWVTVSGVSPPPRLAWPPLQWDAHDT